jgi:putative acetyltransferase
MTFPELTLRAFDPQDTDRLLDIWLSASRLGHPFLGDDILLAQRDIVRDVYLPGAENHVAVLDGQAVGFIGMMDCFIGGLFVDPAHHGHGIGRALVDYLSQQRPMLELDVYADNKLAPDFYRKLGFHEVSRRPHDDEGRPFEVILMRHG